MARPRSEDTEATAEEKPAKAEKAEPKAEHPDTPSGLGLAAAEGKSDEAAAEAYQEAKRKARWG